MTGPTRGILVGLGVLGLLIAATVALVRSPDLRAPLTGEEVIEVTDYTTPKDDDGLLVDDRLEDKKTTFDHSVVDRRPIEGWSMNASNAVLRLDVPIIKPDVEPGLLVLYPSYSAGVKQARGSVLPSVNMIDGKAKQFDDGLYAAIDRAYYLGHGESMNGHLKLLRRIFDKVAKGTPAADYLAAGLSLGGEPVELSTRARAIAKTFLSHEILSKPIGFYTWNKTLSDCFRVLRFFSQPIGDPTTAEIVRALKADQELRDDYVKAYTFYAKLTNPLIGRTPADLIDGPPLGPDEQISLFPQSTSRETELFERLFPRGLPPNAHLMRELIAAIRSGKVDLKPRKDGGWYDHQVYALETLLLPEKGEESNKLLLTKEYKKRMLEAFKTLMTKRRETVTRQIEATKSPEAPTPIEELSFVHPRLRVEPNPTYFLRTARSYAFLANFLESTLGEETLKSLKGLREEGERATDLDAELKSMRDLFYGLYLLSAEDIGLKPAFLDGEAVDRETSEKAARGWLAGIATDPDLAVDTRVSVPVYFDPTKDTVRLWMTIGVRLARLDVRYVRPPSVRPADGSAEEWKPLDPGKLYPIEYMIPVDEFAEVELNGGRVLNRAELRALCDRLKTKEKIVESLEN